MKPFFKQLLTITLLVFFLLFPFVSEAATRVRGYFRKDRTYVQPHYRSDPNGNPYDNWSFPGNTNPYTGETAKGNPDTYLKNYYNNNPSSSLYSNSSSLVPSTSSNAPAKKNETLASKAAAQKPLLLRDIETSRADYIENPHWFREKLIDKLGLRYSYLDRDFIAGNVYSLLEDIK